jgi:hypothetical protein
MKIFFITRKLHCHSQLQHFLQHISEIDGFYYIILISENNFTTLFLFRRIISLHCYQKR